MSTSPGGGALSGLPLPSTVLRVPCGNGDGDGGSEIFLTGVLHGTTSSASDVEAVMHAVAPDAVVIELCPSRFKRLREGLKANEEEQGREQGQERNQERERGRDDPGGARATSDDGSSGSLLPSFGGWLANVRFTNARAGPLAAAFSGLLSFPYALQRPNDMASTCEFAAAVLAAQRVEKGCDVILGDQDALTTIRRIAGGNTRRAERLRRAVGRAEGGEGARRARPAAEVATAAVTEWAQDVVEVRGDELVGMVGMVGMGMVGT